MVKAHKGIINNIIYKISITYSRTLIIFYAHIPNLNDEVSL